MLIKRAMLAISALLIISVLLPVPAKASCPVNVFCAGWNIVCGRTGGLPEVCQARQQQCLKTRCFFFNSPGPRCMSNPQDVALTTTCRGF